MSRPRLRDRPSAGRSLATAAGTSRYGSGIEHWPNVSGWTIEGNEIAHVYDVAWSAGPQPAGRSGLLER